MIKTSDFDYDLPEELIAQFPPEKRGDSKMLVLDRKSGEYEAASFLDFHKYINQGDCIVINNTKVINARFFGTKEPTGAKLELLLVMPIDNKHQKWKCMIKPGKRVRPGMLVKLIPNKWHEKDVACITEDRFVEILKKRSDGTYEVEFKDNLIEVQKRYGHTPLPPYIKRNDALSDLNRYQTVFAKESGAVAAPTAGLHFSDEDFTLFEEKGVNIAEVTLHVGPGTFKPVEVEDPAEHQMHSELYSLTPEAAEKINSAKRSGKKIIAIGTTSVRVLETCADDQGFVESDSGETDIFLYPPAVPKVVDALLTNFHLPKSTLLMLVSTFTDRKNILDAYKYAVEQKFRFFSYGDCMFLK
jgi:S-adenosylmethionine:tRNA ribosyltransferase-isomerase